MFINVTILPSNEALVYGSHWALANLLYWYGRLTGRDVWSDRWSVQTHVRK